MREILALLLLCVLTATGGETVAVRVVTLSAPLNTLIPVESLVALPDRLDAELDIPANAPADLGVSAYVADAHGRWFRSPRALPLRPGRQKVSFDLGDGADLIGEPHRAQWSRWSREQIAKAGLFLWSICNPENGDGAALTNLVEQRTVPLEGSRCRMHQSQ